MSFAPSTPSPPMLAAGTIVDIRTETKNKKAGGTFTVNLASLDSGVTVDFGFKPVQGRVGDRVEWMVQKSYGKYEFKGPGYAGLPPAPAIAPRAAYGAPSGATAGPATSIPPAAPPVYSGKPFPLPRTHGDTAIIRQNALTNSVKIHGDALAANDENVGDVDAYVNAILRTAYKLASFSSGNLDEQIAEEVAERNAAKAPAKRAKPAAAGAEVEAF
jgi:hypothetical protein